MHDSYNLDSPTATFAHDWEAEAHAMEAAFLHLLREEITALSRWDALRFFLESEGAAATLDEIGLAAGRDSSTMLESLGALVSMGWLTRQSGPEGETLYALTREVERRQLLDRFQTALHEPSFRLQALYHWTVAYTQP